MARVQCPLETDVGLPLRLHMQLMADATTPADITGASFIANVRKSSGDDPVIPLTVEILDESTGKILISATAEVVASIPERSAWNLIMTDSGGDPSVLVRGPVEPAKAIL